INDDNPIKVSIYNILALLMSEQDIKNELSNAKAIIGTLITCIRDANEHFEGESAGGGGNLSDLMVTLKAFLQHDQLKNEFIQNNGLQLLMILAMKEAISWKEVLKDLSEAEKNDLFVRKYMIEDQNKSEQIQQLALESFFTMSFNDEAAKLLKQNVQFMNHIRELVDDHKITTTTNAGLKKAADGVLWKLEKEEEFKKQQEETSTKTRQEEFDLMISYSWDDKPLEGV
ncbi:unnamed protein product, partial [Didymodactylos carnosus]